MPDYSAIQLTKMVDGHQVPATEDEKTRVLDALREAVRKSQIKFSPDCARLMGITGLTAR